MSTDGVNVYHTVRTSPGAIGITEFGRRRLGVDVVHEPGGVDNRPAPEIVVRGHCLNYGGGVGEHHCDQHHSEHRLLLYQSGCAVLRFAMGVPARESGQFRRELQKGQCFRSGPNDDG